jgi:hypothetical protein
MSATLKIALVTPEVDEAPPQLKTRLAKTHIGTRYTVVP